MISENQKIHSALCQLSYLPYYKIFSSWKILYVVWWILDNYRSTALFFIKLYTINYMAIYDFVEEQFLFGNWKTYKDYLISVYVIAQWMCDVFDV